MDVRPIWAMQGDVVEIHWRLEGGLIEVERRTVPERERIKADAWQKDNWWLTCKDGHHVGPPGASRCVCGFYEFSRPSSLPETGPHI